LLLEKLELNLWIITDTQHEIHLQIRPH